MTDKNKNTNHEEELVAFIDGELDDAQAAAVTARLDRDDEFRAEYEALRESWELLDHLPATSAKKDFTKSTIEMATVSLANERTIALQKQKAKATRTRALIIAGCLAAAALAFLVVALPYWNKEKQGLADLPVLENLDLFMCGESVEFLQSLHSDSVFTEDLVVESTAEAKTTSATLSLLTNTDKIRTAAAKYNAEHKQSLVKKRERFEGFSSDRQLQLRTLQQDLASSDQADELFQAMKRYHQWLTNLSPSERADFLDVPVDSRIARIVEIKQGQERELFREQVANVLTPEDAKVVLRWIEGYFERHEVELISQIPPGMRRPEPGSEEARRMRKTLMMMASRPNTKFRFPVPDVEEFEQLAQRLSPESRVTLDSAKDEETQVALVKEWTVAAARIRFRGPRVSRERLQEFFRDELKPEDRQELEKLPVSELQDALRRKFFEYHREMRPFRGLGSDRSGRDRGARGRGGRDGVGQGRSDDGRRRNDDGRRGPPPPEPQ